jgi:thiamine biosynthesis lipoprotein
MKSKASFRKYSSAGSFVSRLRRGEITIEDWATGTIAIGAKSATALGPDGGLTDALATALMVAGEDGAKWFAQPELAEYSAWVIDRHSGGAWGVGPAIL